jgi:hypothetical protein
MRDMSSPLALSLSLALTLPLLACGGDEDDGGDADAGSNADASGSGADAGDSGEEPDSGADAGGEPDAGGEADAGPTGSATIRGLINQQAIEPRVARYALHPEAKHFVLVMPESDEVCDLSGQSFDGPAAVIGFPCAPAEVTTYPVAADPEAPCDPDQPHVWLLAEGIGNGLEFIAASGSVEVAAADDTGVAGTFSADFGADGSLTGSFDVVVCADSAD